MLAPEAKPLGVAGQVTVVLSSVTVNKPPVPFPVSVTFPVLVNK